MLRKLIKYEIKATYRLMCMMFVLMGVLSVVFAVGMKIATMNTTGDAESLAVIAVREGFSVLYVHLSFAMFAAIGIASVIRFKNSLLDSEAYFIHSLPVKAGAKIKAKLFTAIMWTIAGLVLMVFTDTVLSWGMGGIFGVGLLVLELIYLNGLIIIAAWTAVLIYAYMHIYFSITLGCSFKKHKLAITAGTYLLTSFATFALLILSGDYIINPLIDGFSVEGYFAVYFAIVDVLYYMLTKCLMENELNLE